MAKKQQIILFKDFRIMKRHIRKLLLITITVVFTINAAQTQGSEVVLKRQDTRIIEIEREKERYSFDKDISPNVAKEIYLYFAEKNPDAVPVIHSVPGLKGYYLVAAWDSNQTTTDFGRRFFLLKKIKAGYEQIARTRGAGDSYSLEPTFFTREDRILILAEIGTEYSWGLVIYEIVNKRLHHLGYIDAAKPGEDNLVDPTPYAAVKLLGSKWIVEFDTDLVLDPGGLKEQYIKQIGKKPIVFEYNGKEFVLKKQTYIIKKTKESSQSSQ